MRGSIRQRGDSWQLRVHVGRDAVGRKVYVSQTVRGTHAEAEAELGRLVSRAHEMSTTPVRGTVGELCEKWLEHATPGLAPSVVAEYRRLLDKRILPRFGGTPIVAVRTAVLDAWYQELADHGGVDGRGLSASSVNRMHAIVHRAFEQAIAWQWIAHNPARHAAPPAAHRRALAVPTPTQVAALVGAARNVNAQLPVFVRLAAITGARRGELCGLRWRHIDDRRHTIHIAGAVTQTPAGMIETATKTHADRRVSIDDDTVTELQALRPAGASEMLYVFSHDGGQTPWRPNYTTLAFGRLTRQLGIGDIRLHDLRHFAATTMLLNGVDVRTASGRLGHARASTTLDIYAHYTQPADQHAATTIAHVLNLGAEGAATSIPR